MGSTPESGRPASGAPSSAPRDEGAAAAAASPPRIVVFTGDFRHSVRKALVALLDALPGSPVLVVHHTPRGGLRRLARSQWRHLVRNGWRWIPHQIGEVGARVYDRVHRPPGVPTSRPGARFDHENVTHDPRVHFLRVTDLHAADTVRLVRDFAPDLGLALASPILKPALFTVPRLGTINLHKGKVPEYRGMPPAFWELYRGEREVGCTVHFVREGLDTGPVVRRVTTPVHPHSTVAGIRLTLDEIGVGLVRDAVVDVLRGHATLEPQGPGGATYSRPTLAQERALARRFEGAIDMRERGRRAMFWAYTRVVRPVPRWILSRSGAQRVVVLLYHRVRDDVRDSGTVGIGQFDAQMSWLARHCLVFDIAEVTAGRIPRDTRRPAVAVTFDGGSIDNHENAFPILLRHRIPAAFLVPTSLIGSAVPLGKEPGRATPAMAWDHLGEMRAAGFTIGSCSLSRLEGDGADAERARTELRESREMLTERLGVREPILAHPFGRLTPRARELVRGEGYVGCLSAQGGFHEGPLDPFDVRRVAIHHGLSSRAFEAHLEGLRAESP